MRDEYDFSTGIRGKYAPRHELKAPEGKYRVIGVDTFEGPTADYLIGDFDELLLAIRETAKHGGPMNPTYCYDDQGRLLTKAGSF